MACTFGAAIWRITVNKIDGNVGRQCCMYIHQGAEANVRYMYKLHIIGNILNNTRNIYSAFDF